MSIVQNVPNRSGIGRHRGTKPEHSTGCVLVVADNKQKGTINNNLNNINQQLLRSQQHSERSREDVPQPLGCVVPQRNVVENNVVNVVVNPTPVLNSSPVGCRSAAEIERELTSLILKAQQDHEEIILEVTSSGLA